MKKCIALILALILPVCALAETVQITFQLQSADELFSGFIRQGTLNGMGVDASSLEAYASLLKIFLKDTKLTSVYQEDAFSLDISINGINLLDMTTRQSGSEMQLTSSLIPGYVLIEPADKTGDHALAEREAQLEEGIKEAFFAWKNGLVSETIYGVFAGDAYSGGTECTTWTVTDKDVAELISNLMTPELRTMIEEQIEAAGEDENLLKAFEEVNERVMKENKFSYQIRRVGNEQHQPIGLSVSVFEEEKQIATLSAGIDQQTIRVVVGLGLKTQNYWAECLLTRSQKDQTTFVKGEMREWTADKSESFAYAAQSNAPAASYLLNCTMTNSGQRKLWDGHVYRGSKADAAKEILSFSGSVNPTGGSAEAVIRLMQNSKALMTLTLSMKPVTPIPPLDESLVRCSEKVPEQAELYAAVSQELVFAIAGRILQIIPLDVLLKLDVPTE